MTSSTSAPNAWAPYFIPPVAAAVAIVPAFADFDAKSALQKGERIPEMTFTSWLKGGVQLAPATGGLVGTQMLVQEAVEQRLAATFAKDSWSSKLASSAIVGTVSSPVVAVFNGKAAGMTLLESCKRFTPRQAMAIVVQETAFVGGVSVGDKVAFPMKRMFGDYKVIDYVAVFFTGAVGSLVGHPANTALTRWQSGMVVNNLQQLMWGAARKARGVGIFACGYKCGKDVLNAK